MKTCSLLCCKQHKVNFQCDGQRNRAKYIPVDNFTDMDLLSGTHLSPPYHNQLDYGFLEDAKRLSDTSTRTLSNTRKSDLPLKTKYLLKAAKKRQVKIDVMPQVMTRHKKNTSFYDNKYQSLLPTNLTFLEKIFFIGELNGLSLV